MSFQLSVAVRNGELDAIETVVGASAIIEIREGAKPANCAASSTGTVLATINLPSDWMAAASGGVKAMLGAWQDASADADGTAGYFRVYASDGTTCHMQGSCSLSGGGGEMILDNTDLRAGQQFNITLASLTAGNA